jgi:hypothetical protein
MLQEQGVTPTNPIELNLLHIEPEGPQKIADEIKGSST